MRRLQIQGFLSVWRLWKKATGAGGPQGSTIYWGCWVASGIPSLDLCPLAMRVFSSSYSACTPGIRARLVMEAVVRCRFWASDTFHASGHSLGIWRADMNKAQVKPVEGKGTTSIKRWAIQLRPSETSLPEQGDQWAQLRPEPSSWAQSKSPIHRILGYMNQYCLGQHFGLVCHIAVDNWYKVCRGQEGRLLRLELRLQTGQKSEMCEVRTKESEGISTMTTFFQ